MNVTEFKGSFENLARPNLFKVDLSGQGIDPRKFQFHCKGTSLPGSVISPIEVPYQGRKIKIAGDRQYEEWTVTVLQDETFDLRSAFYEWMERINSTEENVGTGRVENYKEDAIVTLLKRDGSAATKYKMVGIFPSNVAPVDLNWETNDTVMEFEVTFQVDYFVKEQ